MGPGHSREEESGRVRASDRAGQGASECGRRHCVEGRSRAAGVRGTGCRAGCAEEAGALERRRGAGVGQRRAGRGRGRVNGKEGGKWLGRQAAGQARKGKGEEGWAKSGVGLKMRKGIFFKYKSLFLL